MLVSSVKQEHLISVTRACRIMSVSKTAYYYKSVKQSDDGEIKAYLLSLALEHKRWGFEKMMQKAKLDTKPWNHKRVYRIYCKLKLNIRVKPRKRLPKGESRSLVYPIKLNVCWSMDFMTDVLYTNQKFRTLNIIDDYNRQALLVEPAYALPSARVTKLVDELAKKHGYPSMIRVDNGPEFASGHFKKWAANRGIKILFIQPGKPAQNGLIERFNRTFREEVLDMYYFDSLDEVKSISANWIEKYNHQRPHDSLMGLSPINFADWRNKALIG